MADEGKERKRGPRSEYITQHDAMRNAAHGQPRNDLERKHARGDFEVEGRWRGKDVDDIRLGHNVELA